MKRVLIISFYFPPFEGIASLRAGKFAKFLPEFGWEPFILTVDRIPGVKPHLKVEVDKQNIFRTKWLDPFSILKKAVGKEETVSLEEESKNSLLKWGVRILKKPFSAGFVRLPDRTSGWIPYAVRKGMEIVKEKNIDVIFSTSGPASSHFIATYIARKHYLPWVADFRDLWSGNYFYPRKKIFDFIEKSIEKRVLSGASVITTVTWSFADYLKTLHRKRVEVITNGYDEEDYKVHVEKPPSSALRMVYTGNIYPGKRDQYFFFEGIKEGLKKENVKKGEFFLEFYSGIPGRVGEISRHLGIDEFVKIYPFVPYEKCVRIQKKADVLLLLEYVHESTRGVIPGKTFEYLGARRPILAVAPRGGDLERLIKETKSGWLVSTKEEVVEIFSYLINTFREKKEIPFTPHNVSQFTRREGTRKLAEVLDSLIP